MHDVAIRQTATLGVARGSSNYRLGGDDVFVTWGTVQGTMDGPWLGIAPTHKTFMCAFVNVVPFKNGMQGEQLFFDLPALCRGVDVPLDQVIDRAATHDG